MMIVSVFFFFFSSRRRHTRCLSDWSSDVCSSDLKAIDYNKTLGAKYVVMASSGTVSGLDGWKGVGDTLTLAMEKLRPAGLRAGYHNHQAEFKLVDGKRPIEVI